MFILFMLRKRIGVSVVVNHIACLKNVISRGNKITFLFINIFPTIPLLCTNLCRDLVSKPS